MGIYCKNIDNIAINELMSLGLTEIQAVEMVDRGWKPHVAIGLPFDSPTIAVQKETARVGKENYDPHNMDY